MSRIVTSRLLARNLLATSTPQHAAIVPHALQQTRLYAVKKGSFGSITDKSNASPPAAQMDSLAALAAKGDLLTRNMMKAASDPTQRFDGETLSSIQLDDDSTREPYHFHIYSHRHNTHITVTDPNRDAIISMSCGQLGLKNAQRKTYDAAYQLAAFVVDKLHQTGAVKKIHKLEVILRGFGQGREAATKVLLGSEGKMLKPLICRVTDATRIKFGGTRSQKKRRLG